MNMKAYLHSRSCVGGPKNLLAPHFLDETNRKPWAMVHSINPNLDQRMNHMHFYNKCFLVFFLFFGNVGALTLQRFSISSFSLFHSRFPFQFSSFSFDCFFCFFSFFASGKKHSNIMDEVKKRILIAMAMYWAFYMLIQQVLNIQALVQVLKWRDLHCLQSCVISCGGKNRLFELLKGNVDLQIGFCLVLTQKTCLNNGLGLFMVHFDTFAKKWVHI